MSKFYIKLLSGVATTLLITGITNAAVIEGSMNVDNDFIVVHSQNGVNNIIAQSGNGSLWRETESFSVNVDDNPDALKQCSINVIAWGDGSSKQGFAGVIKSNGSTVYTGGPGINAYQSSMTSGGWASNSSGPTQTQVDSLLSSAVYSAPHEISGTVTGGTSPWGSMIYPASLMTGVNPANFQWIWSTSNLSKKTYSVFNMPCGNVVKPVPVMPKPINVRGDHFQCYMLKKGDNLKEETLHIEDQFGATKTVLGRPVMLCNPSAKRHNGKDYKIRNKKRHLVCYNYRERQEVKSQSLMINNQMGPDKVVSSKRELFCVPSEKYHLDANGNVIDKAQKFKRPPPRSTRIEPRQQRR